MKLDQVLLSICVVSIAFFFHFSDATPITSSNNNNGLATPNFGTPYFNACNNCTQYGGIFCSSSQLCTPKGSVAPPCVGGFPINGSNVCPTQPCNNVTISDCHTCTSSLCSWCESTKTCSFFQIPNQGLTCPCPLRFYGECFNCSSARSCSSCQTNSIGHCAWCASTETCFETSNPNTGEYCGFGNFTCPIPPPTTASTTASSSSSATLRIGDNKEEKTVENIKARAIAPSSMDSNNDDKNNLRFNNITSCIVTGYAGGICPAFQCSNMDGDCSSCAMWGCYYCQTTGKCIDPAPHLGPAIWTGDYAPTCSLSPDNRCPAACTTTRSWYCPKVTNCSAITGGYDCLNAKCSYCLSSNTCMNVVNRATNATCPATAPGATPPTPSQLPPISCQSMACLRDPVNYASAPSVDCTKYTTCSSCTGAFATCSWCGTDDGGYCGYSDNTGMNICSPRGACPNTNNLYTSSFQCSIADSGLPPVTIGLIVGGAFFFISLPIVVIVKVMQARQRNVLLMQQQNQFYQYPPQQQQYFVYAQPVQATSVNAPLMKQ